MILFKCPSQLIGVFFLMLVDRSWCACEYVIFVPPSGVIYSPNYPKSYDNNTNCMWHIKSEIPGGTIVLSVEDLDLEPEDSDACAYQSPHGCCRHNWLSLPVSSGGTGAGKVRTQQVCGRRPPKLIHVRAQEVAVKVHTSKIGKDGWGFRLAYKLVLPEVCNTPGMVPCGPKADAGCYNNLTQRCDGQRDCDGGADELGCADAACHHRCANGKGCYSTTQKCDRVSDCDDYSDEINCGFCEKEGMALCSSGQHHCFHPVTERCNGRFNCPLGEDEVGCVPGCEGKIACSSGEGCYSAAQRCDSLSDCLDLSDESLCPQELCSVRHNRRQCRNGQCLRATLWCDGTDDCGDNSDEDVCLKNSMIALAVMGCLFCGLLLVLAVGCIFRIYGHRYVPSASNYHLHISPHLASRLRYRMSTSVSLPSLLDDEYFHREPPPAYSVAVGECDPPTHTMVRGSHNGPRRTRRHRPRPVPPPQVVAKPPDYVDAEASSSQSSPSRGSITSSSYVSGTDDTILLSS